MAAMASKRRGCKLSDPAVLLHWMKVATLTILVLNCEVSRVQGGSFEFQNHCSSTTVWIGSQSNAGQPVLPASNVILIPGAQTSVSTPSGWAGRFWGRTGCQFDSSGRGSCSTGDCGGTLQCTGMGGAPPATLAEFTLNAAANGKDYYDVSLVDGYNLPISVAPSQSTTTDSSSKASTPSCGMAGCTGDLNKSCPPELQLKDTLGHVIACKSACEAFSTPQYCCTGSFSSPATCPATSFSQIFKTSCPRAYSYAYDDASSIYICTGSSYIITFCPQGSLASEANNQRQPSPNQQQQQRPDSSEQQPNTYTDFPPYFTFSGSRHDTYFGMETRVVTMSFTIISILTLI